MDRNTGRTQGDRVAIFAVGLVAAAALAAALMAARPDPPSDPGVAGVAQADASAVNPKEVVQAPPLKAPAKTPVRDSKAAGAHPAANAMGAPAVCRNCGVVQMVVAVHGYAQPQASSYQMHIRMDDGSTRTVQQRGALAAGSRVVVEGESVRVLAERSGQG